MKRYERTRKGTGITEREVIRFRIRTTATHEELQNKLRDKFALDPLKFIERSVVRTLQHHNLPTDEGPWSVRRDGSITPLGDKRRPESTGDGTVICHTLEAVAEAKRHQDDSACGYAARILDIVRRARSYTTSSHVMSAGITIGSLMTEWQMKTANERDAIRGRDQSKRLTEASSKHNKKRKRETSNRAQSCQPEADAIWKKNPRLSKETVAKRIIQKRGLDLKPDTLARHLIKTSEV